MVTKKEFEHYKKLLQSIVEQIGHVQRTQRETLKWEKLFNEEITRIKANLREIGSLVAVDIEHRKDFTKKTGAWGESVQSRIGKSKKK